MRETGRYLRAVVGTGDLADLEQGSRVLGDRGWRLIEVSRSISADGQSDGRRMTEPHRDLLPAKRER